MQKSNSELNRQLHEPELHDRFKAAGLVTVRSNAIAPDAPA
jgi:hypothetical protein